MKGKLVIKSNIVIVRKNCKHFYKEVIAMIVFDINGAMVKFDEKRDNYNTIRKTFLEYAQDASEEFKKYCSENLTTLRRLNDKYLVFAENLIDDAVKKGVEILVSYNVIVVDFNIFKEKYCEKYFDFKLI